MECKSLKFYQSLSDNIAKCSRGNALIPLGITQYKLSHEEFVVYVITFNEYCVGLPSVITDIPYLDITIQKLAQSCNYSTESVEAALKGISTKGLIEYTKDADNLHICILNLFDRKQGKQEVV